MKIVFDTNIILDVLLNREPFVKLSANLVSAVENKKIEGFLCATTVTTLDYLISKETNRHKARVEVRTATKILVCNKCRTENALNSRYCDNCGNNLS